jgi:glycerophosphoryl diester phosphodiesterase
MLTAHSGCDGTPSNSAEFINTALCSGTEAFEVDVNKGVNGILYLQHDTDPSGNYSRCITLEQAFELMEPHSGIKINCDLKEKGIEAEVFELAKKVGVYDRLIYSGSVGFDYLERYKESAGVVEVFLNIEEIFQDKMYAMYQRLISNPDEIVDVARQAAACCNKYNIKVLNAYYRLCTNEFIKTLDASGVKISAWTVDDETDILRLLNMEVRNITTRRAKDAVSLRKKYCEKV